MKPTIRIDRDSCAPVGRRGCGFGVIGQPRYSKMRTVLFVVGLLGFVSPAFGVNQVITVDLVPDAQTVAMLSMRAVCTPSVRKFDMKDVGALAKFRAKATVCSSASELELVPLLKMINLAGEIKEISGAWKIEARGTEYALTIDLQALDKYSETAGAVWRLARMRHGWVVVERFPKISGPYFPVQ